MQIDGAVVRERGVTFGIVLIKKGGMPAGNDAALTRRAFQGLFPGVPLILASQDSGGAFEYQGRSDIVRFLTPESPARIPWRRYTVA